MRHCALWVLLLLSNVAGAAPLDHATLAPRPGAQLPLTASFVDSDGSATTLGALLAGRPAVVMLASYGCTQLCPLALASLTSAAARTGLAPGREFIVIGVGLDPRAGPAFAAAERQTLLQHAPRLAPALHLLSAGEPEVRAVAAALGIGYRYDPKSREYAHPTGAAVVTPDGRLSAFLPGIRFTPDRLRAALATAAADGIGAPTPGPLLRCFHAIASGTPLTAWNLLRAAVAGMLAAFIALMARLIARRRPR